MSTSIVLHQQVSEKVIRHSLNNSITAIDQLYQKCIEKGYSFARNQKIGNYTFDFYAPAYKIAIEIDGYAHEFSEIYSHDAPKKLYIHSYGITVLKFTDYQILVDSDEIFRTLKNQIQTISKHSYVV